MLVNLACRPTFDRLLHNVQTRMGEESTCAEHASAIHCGTRQGQFQDVQVSPDVLSTMSGYRAMALGICDAGHRRQHVGLDAPPVGLSDFSLVGARKRGKGSIVERGVPFCTCLQEAIRIAMLKRRSRDRRLSANKAMARCVRASPVCSDRGRFLASCLARASKSLELLVSTLQDRNED